MSMWRKTVLATAIVGAGLASTTGAAFAGESQDSGHDKGSSSESWGHDKGHDGDHKSDHKGGDKKAGKSCDNKVAAKNGHADQEGLANVSNLQTIAPINACNNDIPVNVLGVQVPIQDLSANLPILSGSDDDGGNSSLAG